MKRLYNISLTVALLAVIAGVFVPSPVRAVSVFEQCSGANSSAICQASDQNNLGNQIKSIIQMLLIMIGVVAVIFIIIGGIRYASSNGDAGNIKSAKETILYAVIGLLVALMSYAIVGFVLDRFQ